MEGEGEGENSLTINYRLCYQGKTTAESCVYACVYLITEITSY